MNEKKMIKLVGVTVFVIIAFMVILTFAVTLGKKGRDDESDVSDSNYGNVGNMTKEEAEAALCDMAEKVAPSNAELVKASVDLSQSNLANELPAIDTYPCSVTGNADVVAEIFATSEKSGTGKDGWMNDMAETFNAAKLTTSDGKTMAVTIRPMASGLGSDYIVSGVYKPEAYAPSNELFGSITLASGGKISLVTDYTVKNVAGILISSDISNTIKSKYDAVNMETIIKATEDNVIAMGYTNPLSSATGLNFLVSTLYINDNKDILSAAAAQGFKDFQLNVPYVAYTTLQMRESAKSGALNGMVMEYQTYINDSELKDNYEFIPFGVPHNNPLYSVDGISSDKLEVLQAFADYCHTDEAVKLAKEDGFNLLDYEADIDLSAFTNKDILEAQSLWKENKDLGKQIIAVFVADVSGSMDGEPINQLRESLVNGASYIGDNVQIGLVSYSDDVTINLPIGKFDLNQRAYFQGAVESLYANGGTASYDAVTVAAKMLIEAKKENPDAKVMLFLLSDGHANIGYELSEISSAIDAANIPVYTIAYGDDADSDELGKLSLINEAAAINASSDDVIYKIKSLFNSEM